MARGDDHYANGFNVFLDHFHQFDIVFDEENLLIEFFLTHGWSHMSQGPGRKKADLSRCSEGSLANLNFRAQKSLGKFAQLSVGFVDKISGDMRMPGFRYTFYNFLLLLTFCSFLAGKAWLWFGFLFLLCASVLGDRILPEDRSSIPKPRPAFLNALLYSILPLLLANVLAFIWQMAPHDWLGLGAWLDRAFDWNLLNRKMERSWMDEWGAVMSLGLLSASAGTNVAHELVHRTWDLKALVIGRWLLTLTFDTSFAIEHVYGHHAHVATSRDPATARRGESFFEFFPRSTWFSLVSAWYIERERLQKRGNGIWSWHNRFLRGQLMTLAVPLLYCSVLGWRGLMLCLLAGFFGKTYLELVNYIEHYGLTREPGSPVEPRHSWNSNHFFSSLILYNLTRHSHHHAKGHLPFWKLQAMPEAPMLPYGYMSMILIALVPPLFRKIMDPLVQHWDAHYAKGHEKEVS
jgi:alkane 1-monooxygenase